MRVRRLPRLVQAFAWDGAQMRMQTLHVKDAFTFSWKFPFVQAALSPTSGKNLDGIDGMGLDGWIRLHPWNSSVPCMRRNLGSACKRKLRRA